MVPVTEIFAKDLRPDTTPLAPFVIVVDDEHVIADTLAAILRGSGYAVAVAYDAGSALRLAELAPPDLLISDVYMPGMDGVELAVRLRESAPLCRILFFSGNPEEAAVLASTRMPGHNYRLLSKPVCPKALLQDLAAA